MTDQFQDQLSHLAWTLKSQLFTAADLFDRQVDVAAHLLRETLSTATWVPAAARPSPPPPPPPPLQLLRGAGGTGILGWARENRWAVGIAAATGVGIGAWVYGKRKQRGRAAVRRARRAADGGRKEVVVLAGSPHDPIARSLALDLERRGFIVFVVVSSVEDEQVVLNEGRGDIRPLNIDILDPTSSQSSIDKFHTYLTTPTASFPGAHPHRLHLTGLLLLPTSPYPTGPIATLPLEHWSDTLNLKLLAPILTTKLLLRTVVATSARIVLCTPALMAPLSPPSHAPECAAVAALHALAACLRRELAPDGVAVTVMRLGTFETGAAKGALQVRRAAGAGGLRGVGVGVGVGGGLGLGGGNVVRGSPMRELHLAVAEALLGPPRREVCVGGGSRAYLLLGWWAPEWLVGWMLAAAAAARGAAEEAEWVGVEGAV